MPAGIKVNKVQQLSEDQNTSRENTHLDPEIVVLVSDFGELFDNNPRTIAGHKAVVHLKEREYPKYFRYNHCHFQ